MSEDTDFELSRIADALEGINNKMLVLVRCAVKFLNGQDDGFWDRANEYTDEPREIATSGK